MNFIQAFATISEAFAPVKVWIFFSFFLHCKYSLIYFRYIVGDKRVLLQLEDGSQAFEIKDYLVSLDTCESVSFENLEFPGKGKGRTKLELQCVLRLLKPCASNGKV